MDNKSDKLPEASATKPIELRPEMLKHVRHRTLGIRAEEADVYYEALKIARDIDESKLKLSARKLLQQRLAERQHPADSEESFPQFVDLFNNPDRYHGKPVTLGGHVRRITPFRSDTNRHGITSLYEIWIYTDDSQSNPAVAITTSIPDGIPVGDNIVEQIEVTGFFFKMYGYKAQDTTRLAPLILAGRLKWFPRQPSKRIPMVTIALSVLVSLVLAAIIWSIWRNTRRDRELRTDRLRDEQLPEFNQFSSATDENNVPRGRSESTSEPD